MPDSLKVRILKKIDEAVETKFLMNETEVETLLISINKEFSDSILFI